MVASCDVLAVTSSRYRRCAEHAIAPLDIGIVVVTATWLPFGTTASRGGADISEMRIEVPTRMPRCGHTEVR